jgi:S-adenosylmethionine synthetase
MKMRKLLFTSESVTKGHPDKMCDIISDAILDSYLRQDPDSRVACEVAVTTGIVMVMGEITSTATVDIAEDVRNTIREIGYVSKECGFDADTCAVIQAIDKQSADISLGVNRKEQSGEERIGAGDQGLVFGYANNQTKEYMPLPIMLANRLVRKLDEVRKQGVIDYLYPDGKSQVTVEYDENGKAKRIDTVVISAQHRAEVEQEQIYEDIRNYVITPALPANFVDENTKILVNPTGRFVIGGPHGDTGLTGRKIIVDTYGGYGHHGGGAFSGKDYTKVDRSASYAARYLAKNIVAAELATECEIQLAYAIGVEKPVSIYVNTYGTGIISDREIEQFIDNTFDFSPNGIIKKFNLKNVCYKETAAYGHFGRSDVDFAWERLDEVECFRSLWK